MLWKEGGGRGNAKANTSLGTLPAFLGPQFSENRNQTTSAFFFFETKGVGIGICRLSECLADGWTLSITPNLSLELINLESLPWIMFWCIICKCLPNIWLSGLKSKCFEQVLGIEVLFSWVIMFRIWMIHHFQYLNHMGQWEGNHNVLYRQSLMGAQSFYHRIKVGLEGFI